MQKRTAEALATGDLSNEFFIRDRGTNIKQLLVLTMVTLSIGAATMTINEKLAVTSVVFILFGCISWYLTLDVRNNLDLVKATEFQNALFASTIGMNHDFTFIVTISDHNIFYLDRPFQEAFPYFFKQKERSLNGFLEQAKVSSENQKTLHSLLEQNNSQNMVLDMEIEGNTSKVALSIEPIPRPSGFIIVRGRKV